MSALSQLKCATSMLERDGGRALLLHGANECRKLVAVGVGVALQEEGWQRAAVRAGWTESLKTIDARIAGSKEPSGTMYLDPLVVPIPGSAAIDDRGHLSAVRTKRD